MSGCFLKTVKRRIKLGLLPRGKSFEAGCERLEPQERKARVFKGQSDIDDFNCIIRVRSSLPDVKIFGFKITVISAILRGELQYAIIRISDAL